MSEKPERRPPEIETTVLQEAVDHMYSNTSVEMGGFFIGELADGRARIDATIPALSAPSSLVNLTFDHDTWSDVVTQVDRDHAGKVIVGWFHSHPGHGVFLSGYDEFIQTSFFSADGMVALVVDPHDGSTGWFTTTDGSIDEPIKGSITPAARTRRPEPARSARDDASGAGLGWSTVIVGAVVAAMLGTLGGFLAAGALSNGDEAADPQAGSVERELREQQALDRATIERLQQERTEQAPSAPPAPSSPTTTEPGADAYQIRENDTLFAIAAFFYGDGDLWDALYNFRSNDSVIGELGPDGRLPASAVGRRITLPTREELG